MPGNGQMVIDLDSKRMKAMAAKDVATLEAVLADILHGNDKSIFPGQPEAAAFAESARVGGLIFTPAEIDAFDAIAREAAPSRARRIGPVRIVLHTSPPRDRGLRFAGNSPDQQALYGSHRPDAGAVWPPVREGHHAASHNNTSDGYERIARFHVSQLAYLASKLDEMPEGDGTVLDNSCLMFLSSLWIGRNHNNSQLPVVLAGGLGGTLQTGRSLDYVDAGDEHRKICSLYLGIMDRMGIKLDANGALLTSLALGTSHLR